MIGANFRGNKLGNSIIVNVLCHLVKAKLRFINLSHNNINKLRYVGTNKNKTTSTTDVKSGDRYNLFARNVRILNIAYNKLTKIEGINSIRALHALTFSNNKITDFPKISGITGIIVLNLSSNEIGNIDREPQNQRI
ncbi:hypothetical protein CWI42_010060 [Ordospora colligata]|uniref:Leucine-rich repeat-containing protein n=1 Tax=Ordospora colligata OC4 TaxID=1354746 RepID=A0A0B2UN23_9MICR|nr:uncharacterized protein M896_010060 [Ordospora colligata OC4]KHN70355.1 hypothetical protein M896_010060 [Ordospora colligata OC4]TBU17105.1 hypothetical protein CWI41_010060 [Ordospora colligata]TBU17355.1 hypothetical protein CWI40_010060 [Ordospora colligata]TBU19535.1 hypothetical protein CWI42_010060 [Ordospora colligata]